jgi:hypothetical protein
MVLVYIGEKSTGPLKPQRRDASNLQNGHTWKRGPPPQKCKRNPLKKAILQ